MKPEVRRKGLLVRDLGEECLVYDLERHEAHCLNPSAAAVFKRCDGRTTVSDMVASLRDELGSDVDGSWVSLALEQMSRAGLLEPPPRNSRLPPVPARRVFLRQTGVGAALLLPAVISMVAPTPAEAANTCIPVSLCTDENIGQACYNSDPALECSPTWECKSDNSCGPVS